MDLIDEWILAAVRSIENANQDSDCQEVINVRGEYKSMPLFWTRSLPSYINSHDSHDVITPGIWGGHGFSKQICLILNSQL